MILENSLLTPSEAQELIDCFFLQSVQIGKKCLYNNMEFLSKDLAEKYAAKIRKNTSKKVIVSI